MNDSLGKVRGLINYVKESSTAKTAFKKIMENAGAEPLAIIQGTSNRYLNDWKDEDLVFFLQLVLQIYRGAQSFAS